MSKSSRTINIFVSHPFEPNNSTYDIEKFRSNINLLMSKAENVVRKEYSEFEIDTKFVFSDGFKDLPEQIDTEIRSSHLGIVDISENKANIFYEYGLMQGLNVPSLIIKADSTVKSFPIPADLRNRMIIVYENFEKLIELCLPNLARELKKILQSDSLANIHLNKLWFPNDIGQIHLITSTESEKRVQFASLESDNYMLLESLGDKDSLLFICSFLNRLYRNLKTPMYAADNFSGSLEDNIIVIGGPGEEEGDGNKICKIFTDRMAGKISYSEDLDKLIFEDQEYTATKKGNKTIKDFGYFARFPNPFNPKSSVILIHGIHTFGVLGAAMAFSDHPSAQDNIRTVLGKFGLDDLRQASFECFFPVDVLEHTVVCPNVSESNIFLINKKT